MARALVRDRLPQRRDDVAVQLGVLADVILEIERVAGLGESAGPLVGQHEDIRPLIDREGLQQVERVVVIALGVGLVQLDLDPLVAVDRGQHLVERVAGGDDAARAQRPGSVGARPQLDHDVLGQDRLHDGAEQCAGQRSGDRKLPVHETPPHWSWQQAPRIRWLDTQSSS